MNSFHYYRYKEINWVVIPKCGGSCIKAWFYSLVHNEPYHTIDQLSETVHDWFYRSVYYLEPDEDDTFVAIVRNPVERAISYYYDQLHGLDKYGNIEFWIGDLENPDTDKRTWDVHCKPQVYFAPTYAIQVHLESFKEEMKVISERFGIDMPKFINQKAGQNKKGGVTLDQKRRLAKVYIDDLIRFYPHLRKVYGV